MMTALLWANTERLLVRRALSPLPYQLHAAEPKANRVEA